MLGGTYQLDNASLELNEELSNRIIARCLAADVSLSDESDLQSLEVFGHYVGFRSSRKSGSRVKAFIQGSLLIAHNYGHSEIGYLFSYGCAEQIVMLIEDHAHKLS